MINLKFEISDLKSTIELLTKQSNIGRINISLEMKDILNQKSFESFFALNFRFQISDLKF